MNKVYRKTQWIQCKIIDHVFFACEKSVLIYICNFLLFFRQKLNKYLFH